VGQSFTPNMMLRESFDPSPAIQISRLLPPCTKTVAYLTEFAHLTPNLSVDPDSFFPFVLVAERFQSVRSMISLTFFALPATVTLLPFLA